MNAASIREYTIAADFEAFRTDPKTVQAVKYCLLLISEAATKLGMLAPALAPEQPWNSIRALGNYLRHEYDQIDLEEIWDITQNGLPSLVRACEAALQKLPELRGH